ncbi:MAG: hypothetical protein O2871_03855 [bacterium]|nr:hypothetical protein [bacterium]
MQIRLISKMDILNFPKVETTSVKKKVGRPSKKFNLANNQTQFGLEVVVYETPEDYFE